MASTPLRWFAAIGTYLGSLVLVAAVSFVVVIFLAGPHAGLLPHFLEVAMLILGWLAVLVVPAVVAWKVWQRLGRTAG